MAILRADIRMPPSSGASTRIPFSRPLEAILNVTRRSIRDDILEVQGKNCAEIMRGVNYKVAANELPNYCKVLKPGLDRKTSRELDRQLEEHRQFSASENMKINTLGLILMRAYGLKVLRAAVSGLTTDTPGHLPRIQEE